MARSDAGQEFTTTRTSHGANASIACIVRRSRALKCFNDKTLETLVLPTLPPLLHYIHSFALFHMFSDLDDALPLERLHHTRHILPTIIPVAESSVVPTPPSVYRTVLCNAMCKISRACAFVFLYLLKCTSRVNPALPCYSKKISFGCSY